MSILIKGMEMPDSCFLCRFCRRQEYGEYVGEDTAWSCVASKKRITDGQDLIATFKHPDCPLVEAAGQSKLLKQTAESVQNVPNEDLVSRKTIIEALLRDRQQADALMDKYLKNGYMALRADAKAERNRIEKDIAIVEGLPFAQPEPSQVARDIVTIIENEQDMRVILKNGQDIRAVLKNAQPEIIRCKDCKHWDGVDTCDVIDAPVWDNDFCSRAERKENR